MCEQWIYAYACKVYFVEPTEQNIQKIVEDLSKNLYESCYVGVFELCLSICSALYVACFLRDACHVMLQSQVGRGQFCKCSSEVGLLGWFSVHQI